ncbi:MAG: cupin, partial [Acidimicrobiia bacterium]|nr:cupin [Acidimicrobiia bacterium]
MPPEEQARSALARCVGDVERFRDETWTASPLLHRNPGEQSFEDLLSLAAIDELVSGTALRLPAFRLVQDGKPLDVRSFTRRMRIGGKLVEDVADPARVHALVGSGATLVLQALQRYWPPLTAFCRALERVLGHAVQANAYLTP